MNLSTGIDDIDRVQIALMRASEKPLWLKSTLEEIISQDAARHLIANSEETDQVGLLEPALRETGLWSTIAPGERDRIVQTNSFVEVTQKVLFKYASFIHSICSTLGLRYSFLKGLTTSQVYYGKPSERLFKDIDVILSKRDGLILRAALIDLGFHEASFTDDGSMVIAEQSGAPDCSHGYELPTLWKEVPIDTDWDFAAYLRARPWANICVRDGILFVRVPVEIHFALSDQFVLPWKPRLVSDTYESQFYALGPSTQFIYHIFKGYIDVVFFGNRAGIKLITDALIQARVDPGGIDLDEVFLLAERNRVLPVLWYFSQHLDDSFRARLEERFQSFAMKTTREVLDFGDFLIPSLRTRKRFVVSA